MISEADKRNLIDKFRKLDLFVYGKTFDMFSKDVFNSFYGYCTKNFNLFSNSDFFLITPEVISFFLKSKSDFSSLIKDFNWIEYDKSLSDFELSGDDKLLKRFDSVFGINSDFSVVSKDRSLGKVNHDSTFSNSSVSSISSVSASREIGHEANSGVSVGLSVVKDEKNKANVSGDYKKDSFGKSSIDKVSKVDGVKGGNNSEINSKIISKDDVLNETAVLEKSKVVSESDESDALNNTSNISANHDDIDISTDEAMVSNPTKVGSTNEKGSDSKNDDYSKNYNGSKNDAVKKVNFVKDLKSLVGRVDVLFSYEDYTEKKNVQDFVKYFNRRYEFLSRILRSREQLASAIPISRLSSIDRNVVAVTGIVYDIINARHSIMVTLEDPTGSIKLIFSENKPELFEFAKNLVLDEVIGVRGALSNSKSNRPTVMFPTEAFHPDVIYNTQLKASPYDGYAVFLSDLHVGSTKFLGGDLEKFLLWINGKSADPKQRMIASSVRYVFVLGDLVDGVGVYPGQESELLIKDIQQQYLECARYLSKIPKHIPLIVIPGNHDAVRLEEPQPTLSKDFARPIWELSNSIMLTNPSLISIDKSDNFSGLKVLMYHGYSFDYYVANVDSIRLQGGYDRADLIMKFLMERRHLAPTHASSVYIPDPRDDFMAIKEVPDIFATGHIHKTSVSNYKGITMLSSSCWQDRTSFQEKVGHHPEPSRVPVINLRTREVTILNFGK